MSLPVDDAPPPAPEWLLTYGDLMSLLLTFFIMLVAMTDWSHEDRVIEAVEAIQRRFGDGNEAEGDEARPGTPATGPIGARPWVRPYGIGRNAALGGAVLFAEGSASLAPAEVEQLRALAARLQGKGQRIEVRAHTTRRPLPGGGEFADHWDLAFARAREVQGLLVAAGIDPTRLRLSAAGGNEPAYVGDDPLGNRENSRVDVFLLDEFAGPNDAPQNSASSVEKLR